MNDNSSPRRGQPGRRGTSERNSFPPVDITDLPINTVLDRLSVVSQTGPIWSARCPHHHDSRPSLSVAVTESEKVLLYCHCGCTLEEIVNAIGLSVRDLFPSAYALRHGKRRGTYSVGQYIPDTDLEPDIDYTRFADFHRASKPGRNLLPLAAEWGLPLNAVERLEIGTDNGRWVIPEKSGPGRIVGICFRYEDGRRSCLKGGHRGLIIPSDTMPVAGNPIYLAEGASDTAAFLSVNETAIGRAAASLTRRAFYWLIGLLSYWPVDDVIVVADRDAAGEAGAATLASQLKQTHPRWRIRSALPARPYKDVRDQIVAGQWARGLIVKEVMQ